MWKTFEYLEEHIELESSKTIRPGMCCDLSVVSKYRTNHAMVVHPHVRCIEESLKIMGLEQCNPSNSPKLDKENISGDEKLFEQAAEYHTVVCKLINLSNQRPDIQSTMRWLCEELHIPTVKQGRQLIKLCRYLKGTKNLATRLPVDGQVTQIDGFPDGDWAQDDDDRKSVSGGAIMVAGCRIQSYSRGTVSHALSSEEIEMMATSELLKESMTIRSILEFIGFGKLMIMLHIESSACRGRFMWMEDQAAKGVFTTSKIACDANPGYMLTHPPNAADVVKFREKLGLFPIDLAVNLFEAVKTGNNSGGTNVNHYGARVAAVMLAAAKGVQGAESGSWETSADVARVAVTSTKDVMALIGVMCVIVMVVIVMRDVKRWLKAQIALSSIKGDEEAAGEPAPARQ